MKTMMKIFGLAILMSAFGHCNKSTLFKDDELHLEKVPYTGDELRIDGYYYQEVDSVIYNVYFFYTNGVILYSGSSFSDHDEIFSYIDDEFFVNEAHKNYKSMWGVFQIDGNLIKFERWYPSQPPLKAYVREGEIINDTTFKITQSYRIKDGEKTERKDRDETYHFNEFSPKPDSTNKFVD